MTLWIAGKSAGDKSPVCMTELQGVFDTREAALEVCKDLFSFIAPITLNMAYPQEATPWENVEFPAFSRQI
jgi:hypothetical protein